MALLLILTDYIAREIETAKTLSMGIPVLRVFLCINDVQRLVLAQKRPNSYILGENWEPIGRRLLVSLVG